MSESKSDNIGKLKKVFSLLWRGAIFGTIAVFVMLVTFWLVVLPLSGFWKLDIQDSLMTLLIALLAGVILGLPSGAIGGLVVGSVWKNNRAPIIGGVVLALVLLVTIYFLAPCPFYGGC